MRKRIFSLALALTVMFSLLVFPTMAEDTRTQCVCGGKAAGKPGHTCKDVEFKPWTNTTSLPRSGNYYLTENVTISNYLHPNGELHLDLNGKNITRTVTTTSNTQAFAIANNYSFSITDSTANPGTISRDLSALTDAQKQSITNWGLCIIVNKNYTGTLNLYDGIYDSTGCYSGGGSVISNTSTTYPINIYGGEYKGGIGPKGSVYSTSALSIYGGKFTGAVTTDTGYSAVYVSGTTLALSGNAQITGNTYSDDTAANILLAPNQLTIKGNFTGNVSITPSGTLTVGEVFGAADNAAIQGTITLEGYPDHKLSVNGSDLVVSSGYKIMAVIGMNTTYYNSLEEAIGEYAGDKAILKLLGDASDEEITITQDTYIDLNGYNIGGVDVTSGTLYLYDSQTDDYTINDSRGYGKVKTATGDVQALPSGELFQNGYLMIEGNDGVSFHRLNVGTTGVVLKEFDVNTHGAAIYYASGFGGDELVQGEIKAFGIAMGAGHAPDFKDKTYTRTTDMSKWESGKLNTFNGTVLKKIMQAENSFTINNRNASIQIYSQAYVELNDGTRILGSSYNLSLKQIMEGTTTSTGIDGLWETLNDPQKNSVRAMYQAFSQVMDTWKIPYIKNDITGEELPYEDDGILKVLLIGHSLGVDSAYFFPEVYKEATGKDVVVGILYHSGCRLTQHVGYINNNSKQYIYHEFDTRVDKEWRIANAISTEGAAMTFQYIAPNGALEVYDTSGVTMKDGIARADWDVVVMQAGVYEAAGIQESATYQAEIINDVKTIQAHVLANDIEKRSTPKFAWNITWASPSSDASFWNSNTDYVNLYKNRNQSYYWQYGKDANDMYADIAKTYQTKATAAYDWDYLMPSGTALHNAKSLMADELLYRDIIHTNDFGRLMAAYVWTCQIEGKTMDDFNGVTSIYSKLRFNTADRNSGNDYVLTADEQTVLIKAVNAALANPLALTDLSN